MLKSLAKSAYRRLPFKRHIFALLRPIGLPPRLTQHLHFTGPFDTRLGFRMHAHGEILENELFWGGDWERASLHAWREHARTARTILDIGASTGVYALAARAVNPDAQIIAFEPVKRIADRLRRNIALNGFALDVDELAVSDTDGQAVLHDTVAPFNYSASLETSFDFNTSSYPVRTVALDSYLAQRGWPPVDLIKIDVETHEPAVFRGMQETVRRFRPTILVEVLSDEIGRQLALPGYLYFTIDEAHGLKPADRPRALGGRNWNNLLVSEDR